MGPPPAWSISRSAILHWRVWDDEYVVYHEQSGDTHRLNLVGARVLEILAERPATAVELTTRLSAAQGKSPVTPSVVDALLTSLSGLGLVEVIHDPSPLLGPPGTG